MKNAGAPPKQKTLNVVGPLENALGLPPVAYVIGAAQQDKATLGAAFIAWLFASVVWTVLIISRVRLRPEGGDAARAAAVLGIGLLPWAACLLAFEVLTGPVAMTIAFPIMFVWGATAMICAAFEWPKPKTSKGRVTTLVLGGLSYGLFAVAFLGSLMMGIGDVAGILTPFILLLGGLAAIAACGVLQAAGQPAPSPPHSETS